MSDTYSERYRAREQSAIEEEYRELARQGQAEIDAEIEAERQKKQALTPPPAATGGAPSDAAPSAPSPAAAPLSIEQQYRELARQQEPGAISPEGGAFEPAPSAELLVGGHAAVSGMQAPVYKPPPWAISAQEQQKAEQEKRVWVQENSSRGFADMAWAVASDVSYGLFAEGMGQWAIGGRIAFQKHFIQTMEDLGRSLESVLPQRYADEGDRQRANRDAIRQLMKEAGVETDIEKSLPSWLGGKPTTVTGKFIRGISEMRLSFLPFTRALKGAGMNSWLATTAAGGATGFISFANDDENLTRLMIDYAPATKNAVTEFLATQPDDSGATKRLKSAFEGVLIGLPIEGAIKLAPWLVKKWDAVRAARSAPFAATLQKRHSEALGLRQAIHGADEKNLPLVEVVPSAPPTQFTVPRPTAAVASETADAATAAGQIAAKAEAPVFTQLTEQDINWAATLNKTEAEKEIAKLADDVIRKGYYVEALPDDAARASQYVGGQWVAQSADTDVEKLMAIYSRNAGVSKEMFDDLFTRAWNRARAANVPPRQRKGVTIKAGEYDPGVPGNVLGKALVDAEEQNIARQAFGPAAGDTVPQIDFQFNFRAMGGDDIDTVIGSMMEHNTRIHGARRGTLTWAETMKAADAYGVTPEEVVNWQKGQPKNAAQIVAAGDLMLVARNELMRLAYATQNAASGIAEQYALRHQFMLVEAISEKFVGARAEVGRALNAMKIASRGDNIQYIKAIQGFMASSGGDKTARGLAAMLIDLETKGFQNGAIRAAARRGWRATSMDMVKEGFTSGLLWATGTSLRNFASDFIVAGQQALEREAAAVGDIIMRTPMAQRISPGEGMAGLFGQISAYKAAFRMAGQTLESGESQFAKEVGGTVTSQFDNPTRTISSARIAIERGYNASQAAKFAETNLGQFYDFVGAGITTPFRLLSAADDFFKAGGYAFEVHAQAHRTATRKGLQGRAWHEEVHKLINNPSEEVKLAAINHASYVTFQNDLGKAGNHFLQMRNSSSLPLWYVFPFVKTPINIMTYGFERTPMALAFGHVREQIATGGPARSIALARIAAGTGLMAVYLDYASSGAITGPGPVSFAEKEAWRRQKWQPWSVMTADGKFYSYNNTDPVTLPMAFASTITELIRRKDIDPETVDELREWIAFGAGALSLSILDRSFTHGAQQIVNAIEGAERGTGGGSQFQYQAFGSMMPLSSLLNQIRRIDDPIQREVNGFWDSWKSRLPVLSRTLKPRRDLWGRPMEPQQVHGMAYDALIPWSVSKLGDNPIDDVMVKLGVGVAPIRHKTTIYGVAIDLAEFPWVKDYLERAAGNELKWHRHKGTMDVLNETVEGRGFYAMEYMRGSDGPKGKKAAVIRQIIQEGRDAAEQQLLVDAPQLFPEFYEKWKENNQKKHLLGQPIIGGKVIQPVAIPPRLPRMHPPLPAYVDRPPTPDPHLDHVPSKDEFYN